MIATERTQAVGGVYTTLPPSYHCWLEAIIHPEGPSLGHLYTSFLVCPLFSCKYWDFSEILRSHRMRLLQPSRVKSIKMKFLSVEATKLKKIYDDYKIERPNLKPPLLLMKPALLTKAHRTWVSAWITRLVTTVQILNNIHVRKWCTKLPGLIYTLKLYHSKTKVNTSCTRHGGLEWRCSSTHSI